MLFTAVCLSFPSACPSPNFYEFTNLGMPLLSAGLGTDQARDINDNEFKSLCNRFDVPVLQTDDTKTILVIEGPSQ